MEKKFLLMKFLMAFILLCGACTKVNTTFMVENKIPTVKDTTVVKGTPTVRPDTVVNNIDTAGTENSVPLNAKQYQVGSGSGRLSIDGSIYKLTGPTIFLVKGGKYESIEIKNLRGTSKQPIQIRNVGLVIISSYMSTNNVSYLTISGDNTTGIRYGFKLQDISYRGLTMYGKMQAVTIKNFMFKNVRDRSITGSNDNGYGLRYDGTENTRTDDFKVLQCHFDNAGSIG